MIACLSSSLYDLAGALTLELSPETDFGETRRRVNRVATLDGGAVVNDAGFSPADRTIKLAFEVATRAEDAAVRWVVETHQRLTLSCALGCFLVVPESYQLNGTAAKLSLLVLEKLN